MQKLDSKYLTASVILALIGVIFGLVVKNGIFLQLDLTVGQAFQAFQPAWLIAFTRFISVSELAIFFVALIWLILLLRRHQSTAAKLVILAVFSWIINRLLKLGFNIACPTSLEFTKFSVAYSFSGMTNQVFGPCGFFNPLVCYPSGHVFNYLSFWGATFFLRTKITDNKIFQRLIALVSFGFIVFVGIARISLGAHWLSDVIGGYLFGFSWLFLLIYLYHDQYLD